MLDTVDRNPKTPAERRREFEQATAGCLPGILYSFNIADLKRRNMHLGHFVGDEDIKEFEDTLKSMAPKDALVARLDGVRWFMLCRKNENALVQALLDSYHCREPIRAGWQVEARRNGSVKTASAAVDAEISRSVRCLYLPVEDAASLSAAISTIRDNDYALPVDEPLPWPESAGLRAPWKCVSRYPGNNPVCPYCGGKDIEWDDGDGAVYSGSGACKNCGAEYSEAMFDGPVTSAAE